jgi:hypothetical protein
MAAIEEKTCNVLNSDELGSYVKATEETPVME